MKHRLGLARFWPSTLLGVEPWLVLSFIAYIVAYLAYLGLRKTTLPDWAGVALLARETFWHRVVLSLLININYTHNLGCQQGFDITVSGWQYG
jgi:hypothetical protein